MVMRNGRRIPLSGVQKTRVQRKKIEKKLSENRSKKSDVSKAYRDAFEAKIEARLKNMPKSMGSKRSELYATMSLADATFNGMKSAVRAGKKRSQRAKFLLDERQKGK
jgi:hypothetical protein